MRPVGIAVFCLLCVVPFEAAGSFWLDTIEFNPPYPLPTEMIEVTVSGMWGDACVPNAIWAEVTGPIITISVFADYPPNIVCAYVVMPWGLSTWVGPLEPGVYQVVVHVYPYGYGEQATLVVGGPAVYYCAIDTGGSRLIQSGGIAGIYQEYAIEGQFRFVHDPKNQQAWFTRVDAFATPEGFLPTQDLDLLLNLSGLECTSVTADGAQFTGQTLDGATLTLEAAISEWTVSVTGTAIPPCCDRYMYELYMDGSILERPICTAFGAMDFNKDCQVNMYDLVVFLSEWMQCNLVPAALCY